MLFLCYFVSMFTGLTEEIGTILSVKKTAGGLYLTIQSNIAINSLKIGDSIAINGACQTVTDISSDNFSVYATPETLSVTNFKEYTQGTKVNLERPIKLSDRLDGHIVSGHIDGTAVIADIIKHGESFEFTFNTKEEFLKQIIKKGSVTIDGISLTVADKNNNSFKIAIIPHTYTATTLQYKKVNDTVNIETDIIAKYIENYLSSNHNNSNIDLDLLERNGFL